MASSNGHLPAEVERSPAPDRPTPRGSGSYAPLLQAAVDMRAALRVGAIAFAKRPDLGCDLGSARRCVELADRASTLAAGFASWATSPPSQAERALDVDALGQLQDAAGPLLARLRAGATLPPPPGWLPPPSRPSF